ncbi:branched-chain amino acid ABC transporter permease [Pseudoduganella sp. UC29_106]|uniref:branched-chain amino acid ABC transporter permease n=1 Tax=Pseudoduganella sp. UC29_106 TaxID=3374553 RepID=UPI003756E7C8
MDTLALGLFNGVTYGMLMFLMAAGLTLVFSMLGVLNFAHTAFYMLGAYFSYTFAQLLGLGFWAGLVAAPLCCALLGAAVERYGLRHVMRYGLLGPLLFTFALDFVLVEVVTLVWGKQPVAYQVPASLDFALFTFHGIEYSAYRFFALSMSLVVLASLFIMLKTTRIGVTVRASLSHPDVVNSLGHNLPALRAGVFVLGAALAGLAGALAGNLLGTEPGMANQLGTQLFIIIVVGGLGSLAGAFVASILLGVLQTLAISTGLSWAELLGPLQQWAAGVDALAEPVSRFAPLIPFAMVLAVLLFRPRGLMGQRE